MVNNQIIAIDIPYGVYAAQQAYYREAFIAALASTLEVQRAAVTVTNFQQSSQGTTLIYYQIILEGSNSDVSVSSEANEALFDVDAENCQSIDASSMDDGRLQDRGLA